MEKYLFRERKRIMEGLETKEVMEALERMNWRMHWKQGK